ncbi:hypothetical protein [uncultured Rikenella sp.]|uniref:hypothetical protein n=1 Tax=uncultured Rikenella sp. TaxID=368003 RepID=UPI00272969C8|nr:hypothetical protein [uncultured Rikenella sp.]
MPLGRNGTPAPGYRWSASGVLDGYGNVGFCYSSSVHGSGGMYLYFDTQNLNPSHSDGHAYGLQLRCLSE